MEIRGLISIFKTGTLDVNIALKIYDKITLS